jgi:4-carboxymuconolactone decarboxylase
VTRLPDAVADDAVAARIRSRRGGELRPVDQALLHSPPIADGWNDLLGAIRGRTTLAADLREIVILRVAVLNGAAYEWDSHEPVARRCGLRDDQLEALRAELPGVPLTPLQLLVIACTDALTRDVGLPDPIFDQLREHFDDRQVVELIATVAAYNMVSRLVVALQISSKEPRG